MTEENTQQSQNNEQSSFAKASEDELNELKKKCEEYLNNWKRSAADFINYKKDEMERLATLGSYAKESMIIKILPILDTIDLAEKSLPEDIRNNDWSKGFLQIKKQIQEFLKKEGIEEIEALGKQLDPATMETIGEVEGNAASADLPAEASAQAGATATEAGTVAEVVQKGYKIGEQLIRPVRVRVTK